MSIILVCGKLEWVNRTASTEANTRQAHGGVCQRAPEILTLVQTFRSRLVIPLKPAIHIGNLTEVELLKCEDDSSYKKT